LHRINVLLTGKLLPHLFFYQTLFDVMTFVVKLSSLTIEIIEIVIKFANRRFVNENVRRPIGVDLEVMTVLLYKF